ncbi:ECF-type sigma factor [Rhodohalobacter sp. SW132]|uniref:ECF-type sigma factor n=1 Tax=Rhodohalobacter sp. SW132 TaxID=2293433 RepID=UPI0013142C77|nr:ECF-type sigma factor [Rhodohalobacter sp. SW132]
MNPETHTPTRLIQEFSAGDSTALNQLFELIYEELHSVARRQRNRWNGMNTLNTVALIHETYLKLWKHQPDQIENRRHFLAIASKAMRQVLINYAEKKAAQKRGGNAVPVSASEIELIADDQAAIELLEINEILNQLERENERQAKVFECRFFGGMTVEETAFAVDISPATVKRDWQAACNWIYNETM